LQTGWETNGLVFCSHVRYTGACQRRYIYPLYLGKTAMIKNWKHKWLRDFYIEDKHTKNIPSELSDIVFRKLQLVDDAIDINDLRVPPSNRLEKKKGTLKSYYSIRVNDQYRILFQWNNGHAENLWFCDYH